MPRTKNHKLRTALAVAMTLALAAVVSLALPGRPTVSGALDVAAAPDEAPVPAVRGTHEDTAVAPGLRSLVPTQARAASAWLLTGRCVDPSHLPIAGARVRARVRHGVGADQPAVLDQWLRADGEGVFQWQLPEALGVALVRLEPDPEHWMGMPLELMLAADAPPPAPVELRLLALDLTLRGRVTDATGTPIPGATVGLGLHATLTAVCDAHGQYALRGASGIAGHRLFARAPGHATQNALVPDSRHQREHVLDFALMPEAVLIGTVRDQKGAPVADAVVASVMSWTSTRTGADGTFCLGGQDPTARYTSVSVQSPGFVSWSQGVELVGSTTRQDVVLRRGVALTGVVVDASQRPVAGAAVRVDAFANPFTAPAAVSDRDGRFLLPCLEPVATVVYAHHAEGIAVQTVVPATDTPIRLVLAPCRRIQGVVASTTGEPVPHAEVHFSARDLSHGFCRADGEGRFTAAGLPEDVYYFEAYAPRWQQVLPDPKARFTPADVQSQRAGNFRPFRGEGPIAAGRSDVVLRMTRNAGLAGQVVDDQTGQPIPRFRIRFVRVVETRPEDQKDPGGYSVAWLRDGLRFVDPAGTWCTGEQETLPPGQPFAVEAWAEGYAPAIAERELARVDPHPDECVLRLRPGGVLAGVVVRKDSGAPIASALVTLVPARHPLAAQEYPHPTTTTGTDGTFRFSDLAPGNVSLWVRTPGLPNVLDGPFPVRAGTSPECRVAVGTGAECAGLILDEAGQVVPGAEVELRPQEVPAATMDRSPRATRADAEGRYRFTGLCAGLYQLSHRAGNGVPRPTATTRWIELGRDATRELTFDPRSGDATLRATVLVDGVAPAQVVFEVRYARERNGITTPWSELPPMYLRRVAGGRLELGKLAAGTVVLALRIKQADGRMEYRTETVVLVAGAVTERVLRY